MNNCNLNKEIGNVIIYEDIRKNYLFNYFNDVLTAFPEKVNFRSQILERPSIGEYWNILGIPVLPENVIFTFFRMC